MAEELVMTVNSNIKQVTKETQDWGKTLGEVNDQIKIQNKVVTDLEKELIELKAKQDAIPKGAFYSGMGDLNKKIRETTNELKLEKIGLKDLKNQQKEATTEVKKFNKEQKESQDVLKGTIGDFQVFGVSLNGIKKSVSGIIPLIKLMFKSITAGLLSTGIGAFVIAFGSLVTFVTSTKEGMDKLNVVLAKVSATFNVLKDRFSTFGKAVFEIIKNPIKGFSKAQKILEGNTKGVVDEMRRESAAAAQLALDTQALRDKTNDFRIAKAETRKEIEKARLLSEDETKSAEVRLDALQKALKLEQETSAQEVELAKERMRIFKEDMELNKHKAVDEEKLAQLTADITQAEIKSLRLQKRVMTEVNEMKNKIESEEKERLNARGKADEEAMGVLTLMPRLAQESADGIIQADNMALENYLTNNKIRKRDAKLVAEAQKQIALDGLRLVEEVAGQGSTIGKAAAVASATISGIEGVQNAFTTAQKSPVTALLPAYPYIQAGLAGAFSAVQIQKILSNSAPSAGGGGAVSGGRGMATPQTVSPQMTSGAFELGGGMAPEPVKAFVVTDEMTNSQNQLANIRRRATI